MARPDLDLLQGTLDVLILKALTWGPRHGYAVAKWIKEKTGGVLLVEDRALYVALHRMEDRGWISADWGLSENNRRAKYYLLSPAGRRALRDKHIAWRSYAAAVASVLETT
jgi:transcriptional regulator